MLTLYPIKTPVTCDEVKMIIMVIRIGDGNVIDYYCEWWDEKARCLDWFPEWRLESEKTESFQIGFHNNGLPPKDHPMFSQGDASCGFCNGPMPCNCKDDRNESRINLDIENDSESRDSVDLALGGPT